ncbi:hypothetical protein ABEB36_010543 [Hypothenemus hampei]|uniref:G-protein coupled receptor 143 n=1 Tax=Hypothenemus hampei TaxID=57062 RepID=A0ABD1EK37_HYPHA
MSDPTIQTFCCHHGNGTDVALAVMEEFDSFSYNIVCLFSSTLGILGALYQVLPRKQFANSHRWLSFSAERGRRIIIWLAIADLLAAVGVFLRSTLWISEKNITPAIDDDYSVLFCALSSALTQYFYTATWIWTLCYAIDMRYILNQKEGHFKYYHLFAWLVPALSTVLGLSLLYLPDANCHTSVSFTTAFLRIFPNYFVTYLPIIIVMIINPILYMKSIKDMKNIITCSSGQFTTREREILEAVKIKFGIINAVFYLCWLPNLVNGVLLWTLWSDLPANSVIIIWYIMGFANPLQAFFNALVYRRWSTGSEKVIWPWTRHEYSFNDVRSVSGSNSSNSRETVREEIYPLLQSAPAKSVNGYKSLT